MKRKSEDPIESNLSKVPKPVGVSFGSAFRRKLKTQSAISALQEFVNTNKERNVVDEYMNAGGSVKELIDLLKQFDGKDNFLIASTIFSAITHVILRVVSDLLLKQDATEGSCKELLCTYQTTIQNMLTGSSSSTSHKKVILKLLTAMVKLSGNLARIILSSVTFTVKSLRTLTNPSSSNSSHKLRMNFIHYILSFLMDDNPALIGELLQKRGLLISIIPGLVHDPPDTIILVLNTLRLKIVENTKISKTSKLHTFNTAVLRTISKLYDVRKSTSNATSEEVGEDGEASFHVDPVQCAVHELLLLLCTSSKKGILFRHQKASSSNNPNQLIFTMLEDIRTPWEDALKSHLIAEILKMCPEFVDSIFLKWKLDLQPRVSNDWLKMIDFVTQVVENQMLNPSDVDSGITCAKITSLVPAVVQKLFARTINDASIHPHPVVRFCLMRLLLPVLRNISDALTLCEESNVVSPALREQVTQFLEKVVIPCTKLLSAWKSGPHFVGEENSDENFDDASLKSFPDDRYYVILIDLLLTYHHLVPISFSEIRMTDIVNFDDYHNVVDSSEFRFKLAQLISIVYNPKPSEVKFNFMMKQFLEYYANNNDSHISHIVENVLTSTCLFDGFENEIIIWMHVLKQYGVSDIFVEALNLSVLKGPQFAEQMIELSRRHSSDANFHEAENMDLNIVEEVESILSLDQSSLVLTKPPVALSPVVFAFLHILRTRKYNMESIQKFASTIFIHLMHVQSSAKPLKTLLNENKNEYVESEVLDFISYWSKNNSSLGPTTYPFDVEESFSIFYSYLFGESSRNQLQTLEFPAFSEESELVLAWNMCTFYTVHLERRNLLDLERRIHLSNIFKRLLSEMSPAKVVSCLESLLTNRRFVEGFTIERRKKNSTLPLILMDVVLDSKSSVPHYSALISPYRYKFVSLIMSRRKQKTVLCINREGFTIDRLLKFVSLSGSAIIVLLQRLIPMPVSTYVDEHNKRISEWTELIVRLLDVVTDTMEMPLSNEYCALLLSRLNDVRKGEADVQELHDSVIRYLRTFPHQIKHIPEELVEDICRNSSPSVYKLAAYLVTHHVHLANVLQQQVMKNVRALEIESLFEILDRIELVATIDEQILANVRNIYLRDLTELFNTEESVWLRQKCRKWTEKIVSRLDRATCLKACNELEIAFPVLELHADKYAIMRIPFEKTSQIFLYVNLLIEKFNQLLSNNQDVSLLCDEISSNIKKDDNFAAFLSLPWWHDFVKLCLKVSLQTDNAAIMRVFRIVCQKVLIENFAEETTLVFQMTISHSTFVSKMLSNSALKIELIGLLLVLTRKNTSVMSSNHLPLLLASYKATLAESDQLLLQLLQWYENSGIRLSDCRPYLWGDAAASHYSIRTEISVSLARHPLPNQVLDLFDMNVIRNTIKYFPLDRPLWPKDCSRVDPDTVYDLSFALPLLSHLLAPESRVSVQKFCRSGALCLVLVALSCEDESLRMAGFHCLQRFEFHLFSREKEVQIWQQFISALKNGIIALHAGETNEEQPPRLACLVTTFLANMSLIICEPLNSLYGPISSFLLAKSSFDLNSIPNFFMLFYSSDLKYREHQKWILKVIRDGMRYEKDWQVARRNFLFKFLLQYYSSSLANETVNLIILQILANALTVEKCRSFMMTKCGLLPWINQLILNTPAGNQASFVSLIVKMLTSLISAKNSRTISSTFILLLRKLTSGRNVILDRSILEELLQAMSKCSKRNVFCEQDVKLILKLAHTLLDDRTRKLFDNALKYKSVEFLGQHCDNGISGSNIENCIYRILQELIRNN